MQVAECAVIRVSDSIKGEVPVAVIILKSGQHGSHSLIKSEVIQLVSISFIKLIFLVCVCVFDISSYYYYSPSLFDAFI